MLGGALASAAVLLLGRTRLMEVAELKTYDARTRALADPGRAHPDIVIAAIDDRSLREMAQFGWPFPRSVHAAVLDYLQYAGARQVVFDVVFADIDADDPASDSVFAQAIAAAGNVVLPMTIVPGRAVASEAYEDSVGIARFALPSRGASGVRDDARTELPLPMLARGAAALGNVGLNADSTEGTVYAERLVAAHRGRLYPSLGLATARLADPERLGGAVAVRRRALRTGRVEVPLHDGEMLVRWRGPFVRGERQTYPVYSYSALARSYDQVAAGEAPTLPPDSLRGKTVLVGATAPGLFDLRTTPFGPTEPGVMIHATVLDNLLAGDFLRRAPGWVNAVFTVLVAVGAASVVALAGSALWGALGAAALVLLAAAGAWLAFAGGVWVDLAAPVLAGALAYSGATAVAYVTEGRERRRVRDMFSRYVDPEVVRRLAEEGRELDLDGSRVPLTILFSDIRGFTSMSERLPAETVVATLNEYLEAMTEVVFRHGGTLDKFIGDAVMAFWGAPLPTTDPARRAADAALEMVEELARLNEKWTAEGKAAGLRIGIGISSGEAVVGNIGSLKRKLDYTVIGDVVNLASRLESLTKELGATILLSAAAREALGDGYDVGPRVEATVKGKEERVMVHELRGRRRHAVPAAPVAVALAALLLASPLAGQAAKSRWTDQIYQPGRWQQGAVVPWSTTNPSTDSLALIARVEAYSRAPRWRAEIRRVGADGRVGAEPLVLVGERARVVVVTGVGSTDLARHAAAADPLVLSVANRFDAEGRPKQPGPGRLVERAADRTVARVTVRRPALNNEFSDELLAMSRGRRTLSSLVQGASDRFGSNRSQAAVGSAAARGVANIQTPGGMITVNPDPAAVRAMEARPVDAVAVDAFIREGRLGPAAPVKEDTQ